MRIPLPSRQRGPIRCALAVTLTMAAFSRAPAQPQAGSALSGRTLVSALQGGGYVLLMRHASSPRAPPDPEAANPDNPTAERQLDTTGRRTAKVMGEAFVRLHIPVGAILSSPTYRARETLRLIALGPATTFMELGDGGQSMSSQAVAGAAAWLRAKAAEPPRAGTDTLIVTHLPNIRSAFSDEASSLADGDTLVVHPDGRGASAVVAHVKIEQWPELARSTR